MNYEIAMESEDKVPFGMTIVLGQSYATKERAEAIGRRIADKLGCTFLWVKALP